MEEAPNVSVGARLQARDRVGKWYEATIIDQRGEDDLREVKVHFMAVTCNMYVLGAWALGRLGVWTCGTW